MPTAETALQSSLAVNLKRQHEASTHESVAKNGCLSLVKSGAAHGAAAGIQLMGDNADLVQMLSMLHKLKLLPFVKTTRHDTTGYRFCLNELAARQFLPNANALDLRQALTSGLHPGLDNIEIEIIFSMLGAPRPLNFANFEEFAASVRVRIRIANAAKRTRLAFGTSTAERPEDYWTYKEGIGYTVIPGQPLITALEKATQPTYPNSPLYSFSCYRATEYVILLAIAQELATVNPDLLRRLQHLWEVRPIKSGEYHEVFLDEFGSLENQIPSKFYIPGDRVWFRNPDSHSSNASGYEGSWVIYLGGGLFSNFWKNDQHYTFNDKCLEIYHWRHAVYIDDEGEPRIDESIVEECVRITKADPILASEIVRKMAKPRDPKGVFAEGGCADVSREFPKALCVGSTRIKLPILSDHPA